MLNRIANLFKKQPAEIRSFSGAQKNPWNKDLLFSAVRTNEDIQRNLNSLRNASRELAKNSGDYRKYIKMCLRNIVGANGVTLQMDCRKSNGEIDEATNNYIEERWRNFCLFGRSTASKQGTFRDLLKMIIRTQRVDGECFIRRLPNFNNSNRYAFQILDAAACPVDLNIMLSNGNRIVMGVELNQWNEEVAYYFGKREKCDLETGKDFDGVYSPNNPQLNGRFLRIEADEINHYFEPEFVGQVRGFPFGQAAIQELHLLNAYFYAELVAAKAASCKLGALVKNDAPATYGGRNSAKAENKQPVELSPGSVDVLYGGWDFKSYDPQHPSQNFPPYVKAMKRNIANGLDVAYNGFANDLESVNFSSMRGGVLDERDAWMDAQETLIENFLKPEFAKWLRVQMLMRDWKIGINADWENCSVWLARRWQWVDPRADAEANLIQIAMGATTPQDVAANLGNDFADNAEKITKALELLGAAKQFIETQESIKQAVGK